MNTPNGTPVPVEVRTWELSPQEIQYLDNLATTLFPNATLLRSSTRKYNCHSYAWHNQSASNDKWMVDPSDYWLDGSYQLQSTAQAGDKVYYDVASSHSAIVDSVGTETYFVSKWGPGPLMRHTPTDCPYDHNPSDLRYYRR
ncbi:MAG: hypothetical protein JSV88_16755 [Candidatus Aminicenantes bacterium]|nr:MAG: hypothetical protein JSV88_16755 [Candidatus Aminicenantes bacterium]